MIEEVPFYPTLEEQLGDVIKKLNLVIRKLNSMEDPKEMIQDYWTHKEDPYP